MNVNIFDQSFAHYGTMSYDPCKYFTWKFNVCDSNVCWFTDTCFTKVDEVGCERKIAILIEPRAIYPHWYQYIVNNYNKFTYVLTHDINLLRLDKRFLYFPYLSCWIKQKDRIIHPKIKTISLIASNKTQTKGHKLRFDIYKKFKNNIDIYGEIAGKRIENKIDAIRDYMFNFAILNSIANDYFTEHIIDCFATGTIPIFWGTKNINKFFDDRGIISFETVNDLNRIIPTLNQDLYLSKIEYMRSNYETAKKYVSSEDWIYEHYPFLFEGL